MAAAAAGPASDSVLDRFMRLHQREKVLLEYVWTSPGGIMRSKTMTVSTVPEFVDDLPVWNYDGSSTKQAAGHDSEILLRPVKMVDDPFRLKPNLLVLCESLNPDGTPAIGNLRSAAAAVFAAKPEAEPWFGLEQEYTMMHLGGKVPLGFPLGGGLPEGQGKYYCGVGAGKAIGRRVVEAHLRACLYSGLSISGVNAEVMPGQWEFQVGPVEGVDAGDQLWLARYLIERVAEEMDVEISMAPKPVEGEWNGAGCHCNFSTKAMRVDGGYKEIMAAIKRLEPKHAEHIAVYGVGNEKRLTGACETASIDVFSFGVADRGASIRIPRATEAAGKGYLEDRRPAANCDPYPVTSKLFETTSL